MKLVGQGQLSMGVCYYPDHWDEHFWKEDIERMLDCGLTTIRIAENAWGKIEPRENVFDYSFYDRFLELVEKTDMKVIFGTPTATPPAWMPETEKWVEGEQNLRKYEAAVYRLE